jgi:hypothetical protein
MEAARERKRLEDAEAATLRYEQTLRSYGGMMTLAHAEPPRFSGGRSTSPRPTRDHTRSNRPASARRINQRSPPPAPGSGGGGRELAFPPPPPGGRGLHLDSP